VVLVLVLTDPLFAPGATGQALLEPARRGEEGREAEPTSHLISSNIYLHGQLDIDDWQMLYCEHNGVQVFLLTVYVSVSSDKK
jgi:hypothetical protein